MKENHRNGLHSSMRRLIGPSIILAAAILPASLAYLRTPPPQTRDIAIETFRYGFNPSRIQVNRGDRLRLSFSTRDTGQSFFLQDYDLFVVITPGSRLVEVHRLSRPDDPPARQEIVELTAGIPGPFGMFVSKSQFRNHTYNGPMHGTERGDLIVGPNYLLAGGLGLLCAFPLAGLLGVRRRAAVEPESSAINLFEHLPWIKRQVKKQMFQSVLTMPMMAVFYFVILAGLIGTKVSGRNAGPMVIWVLWLSALIIFLVPLGGRIWCLVCPLPSLEGLLPEIRGEFPDLLGNAWPRVLSFLALGTFSTALVALPPATSWLLIGMAVLAALGSCFFGRRFFCRSLCPVNGFISLYAMTGRLMARPVSSSTCSRCSERFCLTGSAKGPGCPYGLCMGEVKRNNDCGMCTECMRTCAYDNVAFFWRSSGSDSEIGTYAEAWQAIVMFGLSVAYCIVNLGAWHQIRDWTDVIDKENWRAFWAYGLVLWIACLVVLPLVLYLLTKLGLRLSHSNLPAGSVFRACSAAVMPLGLSCWIAFALSVFLSMVTFLLQSLSDPFNWGWDLFGAAGSRWHILFAPAIPWLQVACLLAGVLYSWKMLRKCWPVRATNRLGISLGSLPLASFLFIAGAAMICFFAA